MKGIDAGDGNAVIYINRKDQNLFDGADGSDLTVKFENVVFSNIWQYKDESRPYTQRFSAIIAGGDSRNHVSLDRCHFRDNKFEASVMKSKPCWVGMIGLE